jgi:hypothetical protein
MIYYHVTNNPGLLLTTAGIYPQAKLTNSIGVAMEEILEDPRLMEKHQNLSIVVIDMEGINMQEKSANHFFVADPIPRKRIKKIIQISAFVPDFSFYNTQEEAILGTDK